MFHSLDKILKNTAVIIHTSMLDKQYGFQLHNTCMAILLINLDDLDGGLWNI
jgi:hypothetical protein